MIRANNQLIVVLVCILCLCSGLVGPTLAAPTTGSASGQTQAGSQSPANTATQTDQLSNPPLAAEKTNTIVRTAANPVQRLQPLFIKNAGKNALQDPNGGRVHAKDYTIDVGFVEVDLGKAIEKIIQYTIDMMNKGVKTLISSFNEYIIGIPAPGDPQDPSSWTNGGKGWSAVYIVYGIMSALAIALLTPSFMVATDTIDRQKRRAYFIELGKAAACILLGIPITAFCLHLGNAVTMAIAPGKLDFLASLENLSNLGIGIIFGSILIYTKGSLVAIGIVCSMLIRLLFFLSVAFWPIFWAFRVQPQDTLKGYGHMGLSMFPLLILLRFTQAGILKFLFEIPLDEGPLFKLVATSGGLAIALIALPYAIVVKLVPGSAMLLQSMQRNKVSHEHNHNHEGEYSDSGAQHSEYRENCRGPRSENPEPRSSKRLPPDEYRNYATSKGPRSKNPDSRSSQGQSGGYTSGRRSNSDESGSDPMGDNSR